MATLPKDTAFRYVLPQEADASQVRQFQRDIMTLSQPDSSWVVHRDWERPGEKIAYLIVPAGKNREDHAKHYAAVKIGRALSRPLSGRYDEREFGNWR